jgi:hypothetical protein
MALIPLQLPAGIYRNGTEFQSANRWLDSDLVRWIDNTIHTVGGWTGESFLPPPKTEDARTYADKRAAEYPSVGDQLDALFHAGVFPEKMASAIQVVKDKYLKD